MAPIKKKPAKKNISIKKRGVDKAIKVQPPQPILDESIHIDKAAIEAPLAEGTKAAAATREQPFSITAAFDAAAKSATSTAVKMVELAGFDAIFSQINTVKKSVDELIKEAKSAKLQKQFNLVPVHVSDLMKGFQGAVSKANNAIKSGEDDGEDIERMVIRNLDVSIDAPVINDAHKEDPMIMLPNASSVDNKSAKISLKFSVVSVPLKQRNK